jgi:soluble lytic murein transglycosylase
MMTGCLARCFPGLFFSALFSSGLLLGAIDYKAYRDTPTTPVKEQIAAFAKQHSKDQSGALAYFALGMTAYSQKDYTEAQQDLKAAQPLLPRLADYISFYIASCLTQFNAPQFTATQFNADAAILAELKPVLAMNSPLLPQAVLLDARSLIHTKAYLDAIQLLRGHFDLLPQPDADLTLAEAYEGQGELAQAAVLYQRVYYLHPATPQAVDAASALERLKKSMGKEYPPPMPQQMLARGDQWLARKQFAQAKQEFHDMLPMLGGVERDQAAVRMGIGDIPYLKGLRLAHSEADAERDFYIGEAGLADLDKHYPNSPWRLKALVAVANSYFSNHELDRAMPLFRAAAAGFPPDPVTALCHWRVAWQAYLNRAPDAASLMLEQVSKYPEDQRAASALYFLGRLSEESNDPSSACAYYERLQALFPHYYYGTLATGRLAGPSLAKAVPSTEVIQSLDRIKFPERHPIVEEAAVPATIAHIERARLLISAGFPDWAETEIRFGIATDGQRHLLALELAKSDATLAMSLRHMKVFTPEYLTLDYDQAPKEVWGYLFPLPLQDELMKAAKENNLDPFLVAGLIRQESEFNPAVVSHAHAYGLMQLLPSTGRLIAKREGVVPFDTGKLFDPLVSLKLGTAFLRSQLDRWNGSLEETLAAYNAGPGRVQQWTAGTHFREPAEFIESIPFTETREYVQSVIRNAMVYRQLYEMRTPPPQPRNALTSSHVSPVSKRTQ